MKYVLGLLILTGTAHAQIFLRVKSHLVVMPGAEVRLSQLVDAQGASAELQKKLDAVILTTAPAIGEKQEIANAQLTSLLRPIVQDERDNGGPAVQVVVPKSVIIATEKHELNTSAVQKELIQAWQPLCGDCHLEIDALSLPKVADVRDWSLKMKAELPRGGFSIPVELIRENNSSTPAWISGRLIVKRRVPVARHLLNINDRIAREDVAWEFRDVSFAVDGVPTEEDLAGKHMKQSLRNDEVLFRGMLEREKAVRRGDLVQLKSSEGMWEITMSVVAQQDGFIGDTVSFKNPKTNNILMGQVVGQGEVELR
jgi:flagella basal body P-ring formation protein FlgA